MYAIFFGWLRTPLNASNAINSKQNFVLNTKCKRILTQLTEIDRFERNETANDPNFLKLSNSHMQTNDLVHQVK